MQFAVIRLLMKARQVYAWIITGSVFVWIRENALLLDVLDLLVRGLVSVENICVIGIINGVIWLAGITVMLESDAKKLWCPLTERLYDEYGKLLDICLCLASGCGVWRVSTPLAPDDGYCGLGGRPPYPPRMRISDEDC